LLFNIRGLTNTVSTRRRPSANGSRWYFHPSSKSGAERQTIHVSSAAKIRWRRAGSMNTLGNR